MMQGGAYGVKRGGITRARAEKNRTKLKATAVRVHLHTAALPSVVIKAGSILCLGRRPT